MLSISAPRGAKGLGKYFEKDDYYLQEKGEWQGKMTALLGLPTEVSPEDFKAVMKGKHPTTGEQLRAKKGDKARAGLDLTFSAPKSASILAIGDGRIKDMHDQAVKVTLDYIEKENIQARKQTEKERLTLHTGTALFAKFNHLTSRELDPQLHTHCVLMNLTRTQDGEYKAVHNDSLFPDKNKLGLIYRNAYANLLQKNGFKIEVTDRKNGFFEISGVDESLIKAFSNRREQVIQTVEKWREEGKYRDVEEGRLFELAALESRKEKDNTLNKDTLKASWLDIINEHGKSMEQMKVESRMTPDEYRRFMTPFNADKELEMAASLIASSESVFRKNELISEAGRVSLGKHSIENIEKSFQNAIERKEIIDLGEKTGTKNTFKNYSTREMKLKEKEVLESVLQSKDEYSPQFKEDEVLSFLEKKNRTQGWQFTKGQKESIVTILTSKDRVNVIQGDAGTGKTTYLQEIKELLDKKDMQIYGVGFTGKSSESMKKIGIESSTVDSLLKRDVHFVEQKSGLIPRIVDMLSQKSNDGFTIKKGSILVVDEASMTGSVHFHALLKLAEEGDLKVVIQGDKKQLPSISAGRMHDILQTNTPVDKTFLNEPIRQKIDTNAFDNVHEFKKNGMNGFIESLDLQQNIIEKAKKDELIDELVSTYLRLSETNKVMVLVDHNKLRSEINTRIREQLIDNGKLENNGYVYETLSTSGLREIDRIYANSYTTSQMLSLFDDVKELKKGNYRITEIDNTMNTLTVSDETGALKKINAIEYGKHFISYNIEQREFAKGDKIVFLKNDRKLGVNNGTFGIIDTIDNKGNISVKFSDKEKEVVFNIGDIQKDSSYHFIDHAYAVTVHKSQGATTDHTLYLHDKSHHKLSANSLYVAFTRSRLNTMVFTQSKKLLKDHCNKWDEKTSTLDSYEKEYHISELKSKGDPKDIVENDMDTRLNIHRLFESTRLKSGRNNQKKIHKEMDKHKAPENEIEI